MNGIGTVRRRPHISIKFQGRVCEANDDERNTVILACREPPFIPAATVTPEAPPTAVAIAEPTV